MALCTFMERTFTHGQTERKMLMFTVKGQHNELGLFLCHLPVCLAVGSSLT